MHEFGPLAPQNWATTIKVCSILSKELHPPTAQHVLGCQSMKRALLAEETGPRHIGHWRSCWQRWQSRHTTWPQGMRTTAGRCSWQMGQVMKVPLARSGDGSWEPAASAATGHVAVTRNRRGCESQNLTVPSWNPSSTNMARSFCSVTSFPPLLFLTPSLGAT